MFNSISMTYLSATISECLGIKPPMEAEKSAPMVAERVQAKCHKPVDRVLIYNPDALGMWMFQKYTSEFAPVMERTELELPVATVMPSVTPVCFGTMYTGVLPGVHGIKSYTKPVIKTDSLFDALARAGKKTAIVAVEDSSMAIIFSGRDIDYFFTKDDKAAEETATELIRDGEYEVIICYNQEFDDVMHESTPESEISLAAMHHHIDAFARLSDTVKESWKQYDSLVVCATDHGTHVDETGYGNHGDYIEEDINVIHYYGIYPKTEL
ncbi:MAG: hypothetical protein PHP50_08720 [Lachnospiraceae bacterium]|nr:hypothetical protein [Lachnospiraceae bacterium]